MSSVKGQANNSPFFGLWRPNFLQNGFLIVRQQVDGEVQDIRVNQIPQFQPNDVRVIFRPKVRQNLTDIQQGDSVKYGVAQPGSLYARLNTSLTGGSNNG